MRVALAQVAPLLGNVAGNLQMHRKAIQAAIRARVDLVVFPELSLTGYLLQDLVPEVALRQSAPEIRELLKLSRRVAIALGLVEESEDHRYYNTALFLANGRILHRHSRRGTVSQPSRRRSVALESSSAKTPGTLLQPTSLHETGPTTLWFSPAAPAAAWNPVRSCPASCPGWISAASPRNFRPSM